MGCQCGLCLLGTVSLVTECTFSSPKKRHDPGKTPGFRSIATRTPGARGLARSRSAIVGRLTKRFFEGIATGVAMSRFVVTLCRYRFLETD